MSFRSCVWRHDSCGLRLGWIAKVGTLSSGGWFSGKTGSMLTDMHTQFGGGMEWCIPMIQLPGRVQVLPMLVVMSTLRYSCELHWTYFR
jgi:hypothetical protein